MDVNTIQSMDHFIAEKILLYRNYSSDDCRRFSSFQLPRLLIVYLYIYLPIMLGFEFFFLFVESWHIVLHSWILINSGETVTLSWHIFFLVVAIFLEEFVDWLQKIKIYISKEHTKCARWCQWWWVHEWIRDMGLGRRLALRVKEQMILVWKLEVTSLPNM